MSSPVKADTLTTGQTSRLGVDSLFRRISMRHRSSNPQPHPAVLPHLRHFETPDMAQFGGCPQKALGTRGDTAADCGLRLTPRTEDLAWPGTQKKKKVHNLLVAWQLSKTHTYKAILLSRTCVRRSERTIQSVSIDSSVLTVNHGCQSTAFWAFNRKARGRHWDGENGLASPTTTTTTIIIIIIIIIIMWWGGWRGKGAGWEVKCNSWATRQKTHATLSRIWQAVEWWLYLQVVGVYSNSQADRQRFPLRRWECDWRTVHRVMLVIYCQSDPHRKPLCWWRKLALWAWHWPESVFL